MKTKRKISFFDIFINATIILIVLITIYPLYYTVIASLSNPQAVASGKVVWLPVELTLESYQQVIAYKPIWNGYLNTIYYTVVGTAFNMILTIPAAYVLSKKDLPYRRFITILFLITMYFGGGMVPTYLLVKKLGLINTRLALILVAGLSVYNLIVGTTYFRTNVPEALYEAAEIDGASEIKKFFAIALPLAKPIIAVLILYYAVAHWNNYFDALLYISNEKLEPLQTVLRKVLILNQNALNETLLAGTMSKEELINSANRYYSAYTMKYSMVFIASAPLLIAYPFVQKYFVKGVLIGAVKE